jgi:nitroimidazol reductase NimA-like FMN-containing flavoprotein (pyridoxamine 5'-phosphate oxidase superfamily)
MSRGVQQLTPEQCVARLSGRSIGRVSVSMGALPVVVPVDYRLDDDSVIFRSPLDRALAAACDGAVIAFQVDDFATLADTDARWSVHIVGVGSIVDTAETNPQVRLHTAGVRGHETCPTPTASAV